MSSSSDISPLYLNLKKDITTTDFTQDDKEKFTSRVKLMDERGNEILYVLIRMFEAEYTKTSTDLPYGSKFTNKSELKFNLDAIPNELKHMLLKFMNLHIGKMTEEKELSSHRKAMGLNR
jgi:hypothetical protein